jgi:hypothetical protein
VTGPSDFSQHTLASLRRILLALLALGLVGTSVELVLLDHAESAPQLLPFIAIGLSAATIVWHLASPRGVTVRAMQIAMVLMIVTGLTGLVLHYRGSLEFQIDIDPAQSGWELFKKVVQAKAPPALAPGVMAQLGLLGLAYTFRHPALAEPSSPIDAKEN